MSLSGRTRPLSNKSCNFGKTTTTNQCKMVPDLWRPGSVKTGARLQLLVKIKRYRLCKKRQTDPHGEERKRNKTALKLKQLQHIALVLISVLFYFFSSLRRGDQSTVFCITFVKDWLVRQVLEKLSMFSHFQIFRHYLYNNNNNNNNNNLYLYSVNSTKKPITLYNNNT